jgi:hypothetical protein
VPGKMAWMYWKKLKKKLKIANEGKKQQEREK